MQKLPVKKFFQAKWIFNDERAANRLRKTLHNRARSDRNVILGRDVSGCPVVFKIKINGKFRAIKLTENQLVAKWVSDLIRKEHSNAIKSGLIKPKTYVLHVINFLVTGKFGGIMPLINGLNFLELKKHLETMASKEQHKKPVNCSNEINIFLKKHPWVNLSVLLNSLSELSSNLEVLRMNSKIPSYDIQNPANVFVLNAIDKEKKLVFGLIDQAHPKHIKRLEQQYYGLK